MATKALYELFGYDADFEKMGQNLRDCFEYVSNLKIQISMTPDTYKCLENCIRPVEIYDEYYKFPVSMSSVLEEITNEYIALYEDFSPLKWEAFCDKVHNIEPLYKDSKYVDATETCIEKMNAYLTGMNRAEQHDLYSDACNAWFFFKENTNKLNKSIFIENNLNK